jgi:ADP-dependent NAD(P)H-hydrate dehydratase / NAD(P)H-hydrate epimerase
MSFPGHPILSNEASAAWEARLFGQDEAKEWLAMQRAGNALASAIVRDFAEIGGFPPDGKILVLVGKGHNGGDALLATQGILARFPHATAEVVFIFGERSLRPLTTRAWRALSHVAKKRIQARSPATLYSDPEIERPAVDAPAGYALCIDGIFGFQFRPPATPAVTKLAEKINALPIRFRAAVDLPSAGIVRADFTYATGIVKSAMLGNPASGRPRYLDLGFFGGGEPGSERVLTPEILAPLAALRSPQSDKRTYGHVFIVGGSGSFPGAVLMAVLAALRSGVGLVTAFVPETLKASFAARAPEAMWVGCPETPDGNLALEARSLIETRLERASALVIGPGLGREAETRALVADLVKTSTVPVLLDADALQRDIIAAAKSSVVLTPHAGEFARIAAGRDEKTFVAATGATLVLKGPVTRVVAVDAESTADRAEKKSVEISADDVVTHHSFFGGPVLARGGSGDLLAGLIGGLLAQTPTEPLLASCRGVVWHGIAADALARTHGQVAVSVTQLLDFLPAALKESANAP